MPSYSGVWNLSEVFQAVGQELWPYSSTNAPAIGLFSLGFPASGSSNVIEKILIDNTGNSVDFGDLSEVRYGTASCSSSIIGLWAGGYNTTFSNIIDYVTFTTSGNAADFGDCLSGTYIWSGTSNQTRGLFVAGQNQSGAPYFVNTIQYITFASAGNAVSFGQLNNVVRGAGSASSTTRSVFAGGLNSSIATINVIDYVTIASTSNATDFGDLTVARQYVAGCSSSTRAVFAGGDTSNSNTYTNVIDYVTIASVGNATDFGDMIAAGGWAGAASSSTRGVFAGPYTGARSNVIQYVTIASAGNATDFGDLSTNTYAGSGCSNAHGGL